LIFEVFTPFAEIVVVATIMIEVATLAQRLQVLGAVVPDVVIEVGNREYYTAAGIGMRLVIFGATLFAMAIGPDEADFAADGFPIGMVFFVIYGHGNKLRGKN
jgi:hypothetical protein